MHYSDDKLSDVSLLILTNNMGFEVELKIVFFLFLFGCKSTTTTELEAAPALTTKSELKETTKSLPPLLIRKMGRHGVVLGRVGTNINPLDEKLDDRTNQELIRKLITANREVRQVITTSKKSKPLTLTGRSRIECGELIVELSGISKGDIFILNGRDLDPLRFKNTASATTLERFRKELKTTDFDLELYEADLKGDGRTQKIVSVQGNAERPEFSFIWVQSGDGYSKIGYQKGVSLADDPALDGPHFVSLLGVTDLDLNGTLELIVLHSDPGAHFHKLVVYEWTGKLEPILDYTWGERDCNPDFDSWPTGESER